MILDMFFMSFFYQSICYFLIVIYTCKANVPFLHLGTYHMTFNIWIEDFKFKLNYSFDSWTLFVSLTKIIQGADKNLTQFLEIKWINEKVLKVILTIWYSKLKFQKDYRNFSKQKLRSFLNSCQYIWDIKFLGNLSTHIAILSSL